VGLKVGLGVSLAVGLGVIEAVALGLAVKVGLAVAVSVGLAVAVTVGSIASDAQELSSSAIRQDPRACILIDIALQYYPATCHSAMAHQYRIYLFRKCKASPYISLCGTINIAQ
jgi:hypothetical protein